jgi:hypothetical protein
MLANTYKIDPCEIFEITGTSLQTCETCVKDVNPSREEQTYPTELDIDGSVIKINLKETTNGARTDSFGPEWAPGRHSCEHVKHVGVSRSFVKYGENVTS